MKFNRRNAVVTIILFLVIFLLIYLVQCHWRNRLSKNPVKIIGELEYKDAQVQRKSSDRTVWEDIEPKSVLYAHDKIATKNKSAASIRFNDDMKVDMDAESAVEIDETRNGMDVKLHDGTIRVDTQKSKKGTISTADGTKIDLDRAEAQISADGKNISIDVKAGNVTVKSHQQESRIVAGETAKVNATGIAKEKTTIALKSNPQKTAPHDASTPEKIDKVAASVTRTGTDTKPSASKTPLMLVSPGLKQIIPANEAENLSLRWQSSGNIQVELSKNPKFASIIKSTQTVMQSLWVPNLKPGQYYWRIYPVGAKEQALQSSFAISDKGELLAESDMNNPPHTRMKQKYTNKMDLKSKASFKEKIKSKKQPEVETAVNETREKKTTSKNPEAIVQPENIRLAASAESKVAIEPDVEVASVRIQWRPALQKYSYRVRVETELAEEVFTQEVTGKNQLLVSLKPGEYYYRVEIYKSGSTQPLAATLPQKIVISKKKLPSPPKVKSVEAD